MALSKVVVVDFWILEADLVSQKLTRYVYYKTLCLTFLLCVLGVRDALH